MAVPRAKPETWRSAAHVRKLADNREPATPATISVPSEPLRRCLLGAVFILGAADIALQTLDARLSPALPGWTQAVKLVNLDREFSFPTWYSIILLALSAALLGLLAWAARCAGDRRWRHWASLALIFTALSVDEQIMGHESIGEPAGEALYSGGFLFYAWVIPGALTVGVLGLLFLPLLRSLPANTRATMLLAAAFYLAGALGLEALSGVVAGGDGVDNLLYATLTSFEEICELLGVSIFLLALVGEVRQRLPMVTIAFNSGREPHDPF